MLSNRLRMKLEDAELQEQLTKAVQMVDMDNTDDALVALDVAFQEARSNMLAPVLLERATAHIIQENFDLAYKDIFLAIEHAPQSPKGYIQACNLYIMQCNYRDAWLAAEKGLKTILKTDPHRRALEYLKKAALSEMNKTNILWQLPYDILSKIAEYLDFIDRIHLASSCKYWKVLLHDAPAVMFGDLDLRPCWYNFQLFRDVFPGVSSQYVRTLRSCNMDIIDQINTLEWQHVEHLETVDMEENHPYLQDVIIRNANTLKILEIGSLGRDFRRAAFSILSILSTCTRLTSFAMRIIPNEGNQHREEHVFPDGPMIPFEFTATATTLTHLTLTGVPYFKSILPGCPNLLHIRLYEDIYAYEEAPDIFAFAEKCCLNLVTFLCIHSFDSEENYTNLIDSHPTTIAPVDKGLRHFTYIPDQIIDKNAITTITKNRKTLEHLQLKVVAFPEPLSVIRALSAALNPRLTHLELHGQKTIQFGSNLFNLSSDKLYDLIKNCPALEALSLVNVDIFDERIFQILGDIATLQKLHIVGYISTICDHGRAMPCCGIRSMFEKTKSLKDVKFHTVGAVISLVDFMYAMSARHELEKVHLQGDGDLMIESPYLHLVKALRDVLSLSICSSKKLSIVNSDMEFLEWMPSLSSVKLEGTVVTGVSDKGLNSVFQRRHPSRLDITVNNTKENSKVTYSSQTWKHTNDNAAIRW